MSVADRYEYGVSSGAYATDTKLSYSWYRKRISTPIIPSHIGDLQMQCFSKCYASRFNNSNRK